MTHRPNPTPIGQRLERQAALAIPSTRSEPIRASVSSTLPVPRAFGDEVLVHTDAAINLTRAAEGLPVLINHDRNALPIGRFRDVALEGDRLRGRFEFSARAADIEADVRSGFLPDVSISYTIDEIAEEGDRVLVTRWTPLEVSIASVPADHTVGVGRTKEGPAMANADTGTQPDKSTPAAPNPAKLIEARLLERKRQSEIRTLFDLWRENATPAMSALERELLDGDDSIDTARRRFLERLGEDTPALRSDYTQPAGGGTMTVNDQARIQPNGDTDGQKFHSAAVQSILARGNMLDDPADAQGNPYLGLNLRELCRETLRRQNVEHTGDASRVVGEAFVRAGGGVTSHGTGDFPGVLIDAANVSALRGWTQSRETWREWVRIGSANDYRIAHRVGLSGVSDLEQIPENAVYPFADASDVREVIQVFKYGKRISISREAVINDNVDLLTRWPMKLGLAAARVPGDLAYNLLINGITAVLLQDSGNAIFSAAHGNFVAGGSGGPPSVATLDAVNVAFSTQTDPEGHPVDAMPKYLIVPSALAQASRVLVAAEYDPDATAGTLKPNPERGRWTVVTDRRLQADDAAKWYAVGDPDVDDTIEVAFLGGRQEPVIEQERAWSRDGTSVKVRLDVGAAVLDWRAMYHNDGN